MPQKYPQAYFMCANVQYELIAQCFLMFTVMSSMTVAGEMNLPYAREVETFLKVDHNIFPRMSHTSDEFDDIDSFGYDSLTSMFSNRNCTTDSDCRP